MRLLGPIVTAVVLLAGLAAAMYYLPRWSAGFVRATAVREDVDLSWFVLSFVWLLLLQLLTLVIARSTAKTGGRTRNPWEELVVLFWAWSRLCLVHIVGVPLGVLVTILTGMPALPPYLLVLIAVGFLTARGSFSAASLARCSDPSQSPANQQSAGAELLSSEGDQEALLRRFLRGSDTPCPSCGFNLRDCSSSRCPECGEPVVLDVRAKPIESRPWLIMLICCSCTGTMGLILVGVSIKVGGLPFPSRLTAFREYLLPFLYWPVGTIACVPALLFFKREVAHWKSSTQRVVAAGIALLGTISFVVVMLCL